MVGGIFATVSGLFISIGHPIGPYNHWVDRYFDHSWTAGWPVPVPSCKQRMCSKFFIEIHAKLAINYAIGTFAFWIGTSLKTITSFYKNGMICRVNYSDLEIRKVQRLSAVNCYW